MAGRAAVNEQQLVAGAGNDRLEAPEQAVIPGAFVQAGRAHLCLLEREKHFLGQVAVKRLAGNIVCHRPLCLRLLPRLKQADEFVEAESVQTLLVDAELSF
jgi:hypothetical protein